MLFSYAKVNTNIKPSVAALQIGLVTNTLEDTKYQYDSDGKRLNKPNFNDVELRSLRKKIDVRMSNKNSYVE